MTKHKARIKADIRMAYAPSEITFMYNSNNPDEWRHLLNCYNITEEELKDILLEMKTTDRI